MSHHCYCEERKKNPKLDALLLADGVPEGYCGQCAVCGKWGHTRAHPHQPYTDAWCDEHWQEVMNSPSFTVAQVFLLIVICALLLITGLVAWGLFL
jgi:hypothetical protein